MMGDPGIAILWELFRTEEVGKSVPSMFLSSVSLFSVLRTQLRVGQVGLGLTRFIKS